MIFDDNSIENMKNALDTLKIWKLRRSQDTPLGVLCTLILLDVQDKDQSKKITDSSTLSTLYGSAITKFVNYASSFTMARGSMYFSANQLGIDSFLIDLRHTVSHGRHMPTLEVFRQSHLMCMRWIKDYYWDKEISNIKNVSVKEMSYDLEIEAKLDNIFPFYDLLADLIHKNIKDFEELEKSNDVNKDRWPHVKQFMMEKNLTNFKQAFKFFTNQLANIIETRNMRVNYRTFFHSLVTKCEYFMNASQNANNNPEDDEDLSEEAFITPVKKIKKNKNQSVVNVFQDLIWHIAKNDYLKHFLDVLFRINFNRGETPARRQAAQFWVLILLRSYNYYVKYCKFKKANVIEQKKITHETRNIYSYQFDADLRNVIIFVGTQMLPTSLKYSKDFVLNILRQSNEDDYAICMSMLNLVYPSLTPQQVEDMKDLVNIQTSPTKRALSSTKVFTVNDLGLSTQENSKDGVIWKLAEGDIDWSSLPIGYEFKM
jgi:ribosomal biogenesis protein LAS1